MEPGVSAEILVEAGALLDPSIKPKLVADGGVENRGAVDDLIASGLLERVLAMVDINFSNSMIEAWWRSLKHNWLFLHPLDSATRVRKLVAFYVEQHNTTIPHAALDGRTPDEMYCGNADEVPDHLDQARAEARQKRLEKNRARQCAVCA